MGFVPTEATAIHGDLKPIGSCMVYLQLFTYIWVISRANVGKYSIHGAYGKGNWENFEQISEFEKKTIGISTLW